MITQDKTRYPEELIEKQHKRRYPEGNNIKSPKIPQDVTVDSPHCMPSSTLTYSRSGYPLIVFTANVYYNIRTLHDMPQKIILANTGMLCWP
jgi:hypothetical protein